MPGGAADLAQLPSRTTICLSQPEPELVIHDGDSKFGEELHKLYAPEETQLLEDLIRLKTTLRGLSHDDFWSLLSETMAESLGAQMSFISKRMLVDDQDRTVEMPPIGEPGACLMASAMYYNDGRGSRDTLKSFKYHAYGCPCGYMRHDKVFIIPNKLEAFSPHAVNPNELPFTLEAYIGVPLFAEGKCVAHFGLIWSDEGACLRKHSWAAIELYLHSLEDIILERLLEGSNFRDNETQVRGDRNRIIPHAAITAAQSLKPYARSLSHELRTPMQGVVGMLDVMYATVLEAAENYTSSEVRKIFETLKENIEIVQDSSRRAVEAADNVVHAYDMDMHIPETPHSVISGNMTRPAPETQSRPDIVVAGSNLPIQRANKRRRDEDSITTPNKVQASISAWSKRTEPSDELKQGVAEAENIPDEPVSASDREEALGIPRTSSPPKTLEKAIAPGLRHTQLRNVLQYVVNEGLKVGGRPESAIARETATGEIIEVRTSKSSGEKRTKLIEWSVDPQVPTTMFVDERDLGKLISCVFLNAIKFTDEGKITVAARMSTHSRHVVIAITDTGSGIPKAFLPRLFTPFSQEDPSLTRQSEGLGLGLMVAKGVARKLGGDLRCTKSETEGENHGSEFEMRVPVSPNDHVSRPPSPYGSPASRPERQSRGSVESIMRLELVDSLPTPTPSESTMASEPTSAPRPHLSGKRNLSLPQTPRAEESSSRSVPAPPSPSPTRPMETRVTEDNNTEAQSLEVRTTEANLTEGIPTAANPAEVTATDAKAIEFKSAEARPTEARSTGTGSTDARSRGIGTREATSTEVRPTEGKVTKGKTTEGRTVTNGVTTNGARGGQTRPRMATRQSNVDMATMDYNLSTAHPLTFLVAEDNKLNRDLLVKMLSKFGYTTVYEAYDGAEAVRQMEKHGPIDIVLMDLWMPFMDGYEAAERILSMDWKDRAPTIVAVTADVTATALQKVASVGMKGLMTKPFGLVDLRKLILEYCRKTA